jgi:homoserine dehydrogenase
VAYDYVKRSLQAGKHVVTSNKELVATKGYELLQIAKEKNVNFLFEASVGGGIPILRPLYFDLAGNEVQQVCGILNGTTNYILTKMIRDGAAFDDVLKDAQAKGYAEANPAADVEGLDACRKVCILSALAFGFHVYPDQVATEGITSITEEDVAIANAAGMKLKLLGRTIKLPDGKVCAFVAPHFVPAECQLAHVDDVFNGLLVRGNAVGEAMFYGPGAGKLPTASAVVGDVMDAVWHMQQRRTLDWGDAQPDSMVSVLDLPLPYLVRTDAAAQDVQAVFSDAKPIGKDGYLLPPMPRRLIDAANFNWKAVRPVFE